MSEGADVRILRNDEAMRYEAHDGDVLAGVMTFERTEAGLDVRHTEVEEAYRGMGVAERLAEAAMESARDRGERITPTCGYLARYLDKHPEHGDLVTA